MFTALFGPVKATFQLMCDDKEGAAQTMDEFTKTNPLLFPIRAATDLIVDGPDEAGKTCKTFGRALDNMANSTPVVGHLKGAVTGLCGDEERGEEILKQATRSTVVFGAGVAGFAGAGPVGAFALGAEAGTLWDLTRAATGGPAHGVARLVTAIRDDEDLSSGEFFDSFTAPVADGVAGIAAGKTADGIYKNYKQNQQRTRIQQENAPKQAQINKLEKEVAAQGVNDPENVVKSMCEDAEELKSKTNELRSQGHGRKKLTGNTSCTMTDEHGNRSTGYSNRLCQNLDIQRFDGDISRLQQNFPNIEPVIDRALDCCAEHMAYEGLPNGNPNVTYAIQIRNDTVVGVERCGNCAQYPLGNVVTDSLHNEWIPTGLQVVPDAGSYRGSTITGMIYVTLQSRGGSTSHRNRR